LRQCKDIFKVWMNLAEMANLLILQLQ